MNTRLKMIILLMSAVTVFASSASAGGHTAGQMERAGYDCINFPPHGWKHCLDFDALVAGEAVVIPVKVFSEDGSEFLGTELLLHEAVYRAQPCPQNDMDVWDGPNDFGYYACHHFNTSEP
jgi:hypothetical protein